MNNHEIVECNQWIRVLIHLGTNLNYWRQLPSEKLVYNSNMKKREKCVNVEYLIMSESLLINV